MTTVPNLEWALRYASIGWKVFPVSREKKPLTSDGFKSASSEAGTIRRWWKEHPDAGIGVATGLVSNIVVLDVDLAKDGADDSLRKIIEQRGHFPQTVVARTGGGGYHFYFAHPGENTRVPNAQRLMGYIGIDVRGDGGYVVVPPSGHKSGNFYEWNDGQSPFDHRPEACPSFLYSERAATQAARAFRFAGAIVEGERNATLISIAGLLRGLGLSYDEIVPVLKSQNESRCNPPLPDTEVETIANHVVQYPPHVNRGQMTQPDRLGLENLLIFERSDVGFSQMLAGVLAGKIKYNHTTGKWLLWRDHFWGIDEVSEIMLQAINVAMMYRNAAELVQDEDDREAALKYARVIQNRPKLESAIVLAQSNPSIATTHEDWDADPDVIAAANGVIDLRTGDVRPGRPEDNVSMHMPVTYDKEAECPIWIQFLGEIFQGDQDVIDFVQKAVGYTLSGHTREQCMFLLVGRGSNGKSTFLDTLHSILGRCAYSAPFTTFERTQQASQQTNDIATLAGRRMVISSEPNEGITLNESRIKSLTGGDLISARFLHREFFEFKPTFKIWLAVNHLPRVVDDSDGFWRRVRKIDFNEQFFAEHEITGPDQKRKDETLPDRLKAEYAGILRWMVEGAMKWYETGNLKVPGVVVQSTQVYRTDSDPLHDFVATHCSEGEDQEVLGDELFKAYKAYCKQRLLKEYEVLGSTRFHDRMGRKYTRGTSGPRRYIGIALKVESRHLLEQDNFNIVFHPSKAKSN